MDQPLTKREKQALEMKQKIYETTIELFQQKPYDDITISEICKAADISVGIFYYYFDSKQAVLSEGFRRLSLVLKEETDELNLPPLEKIQHAVKIYGDALENRSYLFIAVLLNYEMTNNLAYWDNPKRYIFAYIYEALEEAIASSILKTNDAQAIHADIFRILKGTIFDWVIRKGEFPITQELLRLVNTILQPYLV